MKRLARRHLQRQEHTTPPQPFFTPDTSHLQRNGEKPFFQKQGQAEETEEKVQTIRKVEAEEQKDKVQTKGADEEKKENTPVMRQAGGPEEKEPQPEN
jgi:hypothetical protein